MCVHTWSHMLHVRVHRPHLPVEQVCRVFRVCAYGPCVHVLLYLVHMCATSMHVPSVCKCVHAGLCPSSGQELDPPNPGGPGRHHEREAASARRSRWCPARKQPGSPGQRLPRTRARHSRKQQRCRGRRQPGKLRQPCPRTRRATGWSPSWGHLRPLLLADTPRVPPRPLKSQPEH